MECRSTVVREQWQGAARSSAPGPVQPPMRLTVCSWCSRMRVETAWREVDVAVTVLRLFMVAAPCVISHGACPACVAHLTDDVLNRD